MENKNSNDMLRVIVSNGKYTFVQDESGRCFALRYGEPWRDCVGDKFILSLAYELDETRQSLQKAVDEIKSYHIDWAKFNNESPDYDKDYKPEFPAIVKELEMFLLKNK